MSDDEREMENDLDSEAGSSLIHTKLNKSKFFTRMKMILVEEQTCRIYQRVRKGRITMLWRGKGEITSKTASMVSKMLYQLCRLFSKLEYTYIKWIFLGVEL